MCSGIDRLIGVTATWAGTEWTSSGTSGNVGPSGTCKRAGRSNTCAGSGSLVLAEDRGTCLHSGASGGDVGEHGVEVVERDVRYTGIAPTDEVAKFGCYSMVGRGEFVCFAEGPVRRGGERPNIKCWAAR